jgi:hypothetical protein
VSALQKRLYAKGCEGTGSKPERRNMRTCVVVPAANPKTMIARSKCSVRKAPSRRRMVVAAANAARGGTISWHTNQVNTTQHYHAASLLQNRYSR